MNYKFLFLVLLVYFFSSCRKEPELTRSLKLSVTASVKSDEDLTISTVGTLIKITHKTSGASYEAVVQSDGNAVFESISPGSYNLRASLSLSGEDYSKLAGYHVEEAVSFNGSNDNLEVYEDLTTNIELVAGRTGNLVFKQIYYAGSNVSTGAAFRDVFLEIYNNSNQIIYADSLYIGQVIGNNSSRTSEFNLANNQYDWSQAIGIMVDAGKDANTDYVYAHSLFRIPSDGTGKKHPILPGNSIILAATAVDHTNSYESNTSVPITVTDPSLTINLNNADFEVNLIDYWRPSDGSVYTPYRFDVDNLNVPNVDVIHVAQNRDMILNALGRDAFFLADTRGKTVQVEDFKNFATPDVRELVISTKFYKQIPVSLIIDAVELQHPIPSSRVPKRLPTSLDVGRTFVPGGQYSSQSLVRRTLKIVNGRRILKDTNNSEEDFGYLNKADATKSASSFID